MFTTRRRAASSLALGLASALLLSACAGSGGGAETPRASVRSANTFTSSVDHEGFAALGYRLLWSGAAVVSTRASVEHAELLGDAVVVQETGNAVSLIQTETGRTVWSTTMGGRLTRFVGLAREGDRILVASDIELYVLSAQTGDLLDRQSLDLVVNTRPVVADGAAFFGSATGRVLAHDLRTGLGRWQYQLRGSIRADPVLVGERVGLVSETGDVIVLNPASGTASARSSVFGAPAGAPAASDGLIAFASRDQSAYAFDASGGDRLWRYRTESPLVSSLTVIDGVAYFAVPGQGMVGLDAASGAEIWSSKEASGVAVGLVGERLLVRDGDTLLLADDRGDVIARVIVPGLETVTMSDPLGGDLFLVTKSGAVSRFVLR